LSIPRAGRQAAAHEQRTPGHGSDGAAIGSLEDDGAGGLFDGAPLADQAVQGIDLPRARAAAIEPVRDDWEAARAASLAEANAGRLDRARAEARKFLDGLTATKVLDPTCGTGNFLYVSMVKLKEIEAMLGRWLRRRNPAGLARSSTGDRLCAAMVAQGC
jgi:hypothetical protein